LSRTCRKMCVVRKFLVANRGAGTGQGPGAAARCIPVNPEREDSQ
jgi:hypothetical protein